MKLEISNTTRYSTEDLEVFVQILVGAPPKLGSIKPTRKSYSFRPGKASGRKEFAGVTPGMMIDLAPPSWVVQAYPLEHLADSEHLPEDCVAILAKRVLRLAGRSESGAELWLKYNERTTGQRLPPLPKIRIMPAEKKPQRVRPTPEVKLQRLLAEYRPGRKITRMAWVHGKLRSFKLDYDKEYRRLEKWREKYEKAGGKIAPEYQHFTFEEYILHVLKEMR